MNMNDDSEEYQNLCLGDLVDWLFREREMLQVLNETVDKRKKVITDLEQKIIERMEEGKIASTETKSGSVRIKDSLVYNIDNYDELRQYVLATGTVTIFEKRLAQRTVRELLEEGEYVGGIKPFSKRTLTVRTK